MDILKTLKSTLKKIPPFKRVVVGVSGGADSVVLAHALKKLGYEIIIAHLNHQLRGADSDADEKFVKDLAKNWGVSYATEKRLIPKTDNLENNAREIRYAFLKDIRQKYKADYAAVAHHLDDQIETVLMHMARGSGLRGQIGIKYQKDRLVRPMLCITRREILNYAEENGLKYRTDESNNDLSYNRNFWRHLVIPYLKNKIPDLCEKIKDINKKADIRLENVFKKADSWTKKYLIDGSFKRAQFNGLTDNIKAEILIHILGAKDLYATSLGRLMDFIKSGQSGKKIEVKDKVFFIEHGSVLVRDKLFELPKLPKAKITVKGVKWGAVTIKSKYGQPLYARQWQPGDKFRPKGMNGTKTLQDFFTDEKIPRSRRYQIPIIVNKKGDIMAIGDLRLAEGAENLKNDLYIV
jgi:tRNA(Ile)-lysidine synthase